MSRIAELADEIRVNRKDALKARPAFKALFNLIIDEFAQDTEPSRERAWEGMHEMAKLFRDAGYPPTAWQGFAQSICDAVVEDTGDSTVLTRMGETRQRLHERRMIVVPELRLVH